MFSSWRLASHGTCADADHPAKPCRRPPARSRCPNTAQRSADRDVGGRAVRPALTGLWSLVLQVLAEEDGDVATRVLRGRLVVAGPGNLRQEDQQRCRVDGIGVVAPPGPPPRGRTAASRPTPPAGAAAARGKRPSPPPARPNGSGDSSCAGSAAGCGSSGGTAGTGSGPLVRGLVLRRLWRLLAGFPAGLPVPGHGPPLRPHEADGIPDPPPRRAEHRPLLRSLRLGLVRALLRWRLRPTQCPGLVPRRTSRARVARTPR